MSAREEFTRVCQGCGRTFTIPQAELDKKWNLGLSRPIFCSNRCAIHGWDPQAIWLGKIRRAHMEAAEESQ